MWKFSHCGMRLAFGLETPPAEPPFQIDFAPDIQLLFNAHFTAGHGAKQQKNGFPLDRHRDAFRGGGANQIAPLKGGASSLYFRLVGTRDRAQKPLEGPLNPDQIKIVKDCINQGAVCSDGAAGETPGPIPDPGAAYLMTLLRNGDLLAFRAKVRGEWREAKLLDPGGSTPLMFGVLYGVPDVVRLLLEAGADPNTRIEAGATALIWAVDDLDKRRLLLGATADPNARSIDGSTGLLIAATWPGPYEVVKLLLDQQANPSPVVNTYRGPMTPLRQAVEDSVEVVLRPLLELGGDAKAMVGVTSLLEAMKANDPARINLMSKTADRGALKGAGLFLMPSFGAPGALRDLKAVKAFFEVRADIAVKDSVGGTLLMVAVASDDVPISTLEAFIGVGADLNFRAADMGWSKLQTMASEACTPGQVLFALHQSGAEAASQPLYQRGIKYAISNQLEDGSWQVPSRPIPFQPYSESGFPHSQGQWIAPAATN